MKINIKEIQIQKAKAGQPSDYCYCKVCQDWVKKDHKCKEVDKIGR